jgi:hypothetical protein
VVSGPLRWAAPVLLVAVVVLFASCGGGGGDDSLPQGHPERCRGFVDASTRECYVREFEAMVAGRDDPGPAVAHITELARQDGGFLLTSCHGIMHTVGRTYARQEGVTLATLMDVLPRSNDPGCSAGFAHGLVTGVAPREPGAAAAVCAKAATRYQRYSCVHGLGHAFMRINADRLAPALALCRALGPHSAPDCAQGAYHDYWFAVAGADDASLPADAVTDPRRLCAAQSEEFVRPCWYRAFVDNRPEIEVDSPEAIDVLCEGLAGPQREACVTAVVVIGPSDPYVQLDLCAALQEPSDAGACIRGTKVQNLLSASTGTFVALIQRCDLFAGRTRSACYRWLGKTLAIVTDGGFARDGCPELAAHAREACLAGARTMDDALVTFS